MLSSEKIQEIKIHLLEQLENFPEDQRKTIKHQIMSMNDEEFVEFLEENNLKYDEESKPEQKCIFCLIVEGKLKSYKVYEDEEFIVVLEINPLSKGHVLVVPKKHFSLDKLPQNIMNIAKKISERISKKFSPKEIKLAKNEILGHAVLEVIPIYGNEKEAPLGVPALQGGRKKATDEELDLLQKDLVLEKKEKPAEVVKEIPKEETPLGVPALEGGKKEPEKKVELPKMKMRIP